MTAPARWRSIVTHAFLAALVAVPTLLSQPGRVGADTKSYLTIDPGRLLARAPWMWDPGIGMGSLTHQTIGYLFPMGPYYWVLDRVGVPDWFAQRLWLSLVLFAAGAGVLFLARTIGWQGAGPVVAALVFMLSPYVLDYSARISVILLPWAALPWLIGLAARALERGGWRHPATFALVVLTVGGVNATALVFAGLGPLLWFPFAVWVSNDATFKRALATVARIGLLTAATSMWWVVALAVQGRYGIPILKYTETVEAVSRTSIVPEVARGLGYWFFYGNDKLGPWIEPASQYTQHVWLIAVGFAVPVLALVGSAIVRWRHRAYFVTLILVGTVIAVGAHPYDSPSPLGALFKAFAASSSAGLALRSTARAVPLVALGIAALLGALVTAIARRIATLGAMAAVVAGGLAIAGLPPLFTSQLAVAPNLDRAEQLPSYWRDAARALDQRGDTTRVLEIPGSDFAAYRWGNTVDPITPYLMDRPYVARELIPYGTAATADLVNAIDRRMQEGVFEPDSLAPLARMMSIGDVVVRSDLEFERFRTPRPRVLWGQLTDPLAAGLGRPSEFGAARPNNPTPRLPLVDEIQLAEKPGTPDPPPVSVFRVANPASIVHREPAAHPLIVAGDAEGMVAAAAAGLLDDRDRGGPVRYSASIGADRGAWATALAEGADLLVTDSNRLRARRWGTVRENTGYTENPLSEPLVVDPADARLDVFGTAPLEAFTRIEQRGITAVRASHYGNPVSYTPEDRPANSLDANPGTAWRVGAFADVTGERIRVDLASPVRTDHITVVQPLTGSRNRFITRVRVKVDDEAPITFDLDERSRTPDGQALSFAMHTLHRVEIEVRDTNIGRRPRYDGVSGVGFAEIGIGSTRVNEFVRLPDDLTRHAGAASAANRLTVLLERARANPAEPVRTDEELALARTFSIPSARTFGVRGTIRLASNAPDELIDKLVGLRDASEGGITTRSDARLPGDLASRASSAFDGDPATAWSAPFEAQEGHWIEFESAAAIDLSHLDLAVVADGRHSVPTRIGLEVDGVDGPVIDLPTIADRRRPNATATVALDFPTVSAKRIRVRVVAVRAAHTTDYYSESPIEMPVAIAELGAPGVRVSRPTRLDGTCRNDLLDIDGQRVEVRVSGNVADGLARRALTVEDCGHPQLSAGRHDLRTAPGSVNGLDIDRLVLDSPAAPRASAVATTAAATTGAAPIDVTNKSRTRYRVRIPPSADASWLVLGQSLDAGWHAQAVNGRSLGSPELVDGYANGWRLPPHARDLVVDVEWTPQRAVWVGLAASCLAIALCLAIVVITSIRRRDRLAITLADEPGDEPPELHAPMRARDLVTTRALGAAVGTGLVGAVVAGWPVGGAAALAVAAGLLVRCFRPLLAVAPPGLLGLAGLYIVVQQMRYGYPPDFAWPHNFERVHGLGWLAIVLLLADLIAGRVDES